MIRKTLPVILSVMFLLISVLATAQGQPTKTDKREKIRELLEKREPPTEEQVRRVASDVDSLLSDIINDREADFITRKRAVTALGYFQTKRARQMLRSIITDPAWQKPYRVVAIVAIAQSLGKPAFNMVKGYTGDPDSEVRLACVDALGIMGGDAALTLLRHWQLREKDINVLQAIYSAIRKLSRDPLEDL